MSMYIINGEAVQGTYLDDLAVMKNFEGFTCPHLHSADSSSDFVALVAERNPAVRQLLSITR